MTPGEAYDGGSSEENLVKKRIIQVFFAFSFTLSALGFYAFQTRINRLEQRVGGNETKVASLERAMVRGADPEFAKDFWVHSWKSGKKVRISFMQKEFPLMIVHVWATWCKPCVLELPHFAEFSETHKEIPMVAVAWSDDPKEVKKFVANLDPKKYNTYFVYKSEDFDSEDGKYYNLGGIPETIFVSHGHIVYRAKGAVDWANPAADAALQLFKEGKPFTLAAK